MSNFSQFIISVLGPYEPITVYDELAGSYVTYANWGYIASAIIYIIVVFFFFKTIGGVIYEWLRR